MCSQLQSNWMSCSDFTKQSVKIGGERVFSTIFGANLADHVIKLILINFLNQGEYFDINYNHIKLLFAQIIAF